MKSVIARIERIRSGHSERALVHAIEPAGELDVDAHAGELVFVLGREDVHAEEFAAVGVDQGMLRSTK